jgi:lipoprotein-releasing system permease protein
MNFSTYVAWRYLFSKSSNNAVNIITAVAILGVAVGSFALTVVLSAFSGLESYSLAMYSSFDPEIKISTSKGKYFEFDSKIEDILKDDRIADYSKTIEEKAFLRYRSMEYICKVKGVDSNFTLVNSVDSNIYAGRWINSLSDDETVIGGGISHYLSLGLTDNFKKLEVYVVKPGKGDISNPLNSFKRLDAQPVGMFSIEKEIDEKYIFVNTEFVRQLLNLKDNTYSFIEIRLKDPKQIDDVQEFLQNKLGENFIVKNQEQQQEVIYRMMNTEKLVTYLVFTLILIIAVFNVIGSTSMLIVDKIDNIKTMWHLGASEADLKKVFSKIGILITIMGGFSGMFLGVTLIFLQIKGEFLKFGGDFSLAYPVELQMSNLLLVALTILTIGIIASKFSVSRLSKKRFERK